MLIRITIQIQEFLTEFLRNEGFASNSINNEWLQWLGGYELPLWIFAVTKCF